MYGNAILFEIFVKDVRVFEQHIGSCNLLMPWYAACAAKLKLVCALLIGVDGYSDGKRSDLNLLMVDKFIPGVQ